MFPPQLTTLAVFAFCAKENRYIANIIADRTYLQIMQAQYTHPVRWKGTELFSYLKRMEPHVQPDSCICKNCRDSISSAQKGPEDYIPRWRRLSGKTGKCEVMACNEPACRNTRITTRVEIMAHLECTLPVTANTHTLLCDAHYRALHRQVKPEYYLRKCAVCSRSLTTSNSRAVSDPAAFQKHLAEHTSFEGSFTAIDRLCMACYRHNLSVLKTIRETRVSTDADLETLIKSLQMSEITEVVEVATNLTIISVAQELLANHALTLPSAYKIFVDLLSKHPRWLLSRLSSTLEHHLSYTCRVRKHGIILFRQGRELDALSNALFALSRPQEVEPNHKMAGTDVNNRIQALIKSNDFMIDPSLLDVDKLIENIDPIIWEMICTLTQSLHERGRKNNTGLAGNVKKVRHLFILAQIIFCVNSQCSLPFHILNADIVDCYSGSSELLRIFNRLGVCASSDTLSRHIQKCVEESNNCYLQGLNPNLLTMFTM